MARRKAAPAPTLLPMTVGQCWAEALNWAVGVPAAVLGGSEMFWQTISDMGTALFWIGAIVLMYPLLMILWVAELRAGLRAARD